MPDTQAERASETLSKDLAGATPIKQSACEQPAATEAPSTAAVVESALDKVEQDLASLCAALGDDSAAVSAPGESSATQLPKPAAQPSQGGMPEPADSAHESALEPPVNSAHESTPETVLQSAKDSAPKSSPWASGLLRPFVGMLTLMDVPFSGVSHESKSIVGHIAIATMLIAVSTWVLRWCGYLQ